MAAGNGSGYLFLVTLSHGDTGTLNRQQLLGSMPKMLDGLEQGDAITIRLIDQAMFAELIKKLLAQDMGVSVTGKDDRAG